MSNPINIMPGFVTSLIYTDDILRAAELLTCIMLAPVHLGSFRRARFRLPLIPVAAFSAGLHPGGPAFHGLRLGDVVFPSRRGGFSIPVGRFSASRVSHGEISPHRDGV